MAAKPRHIGTLFIIAIIIIIVGFAIQMKTSNESNSPQTNTTQQQNGTPSEDTKNSTEPEQSALSVDDSLEQHGFWVQDMVEPNTYTISEGVAAETYTFSDENVISKLPEEYQSMVEEGTGNAKQELVTIDGYTATIVYGSSAKDGSPQMTVFIPIEEQNIVYVIRGTDEFLKTVQETMKLKH